MRLPTSSSLVRSIPCGWLRRPISRGSRDSLADIVSLTCARSSVGAPSAGLTRLSRPVRTSSCTCDGCRSSAASPQARCRGGWRWWPASIAPVSSTALSSTRRPGHHFLESGAPEQARTFARTPGCQPSSQQPCHSPATHDLFNSHGTYATTNRTGISRPFPSLHLLRHVCYQFGSGKRRSPIALLAVTERYWNWSGSCAAG
jgi:hypothetical protein